ncbi:unnamed protein product, partial [Ixodes pacificus]
LTERILSPTLSPDRSAGPPSRSTTPAPLTSSSPLKGVEFFPPATLSPSPMEFRSTTILMRSSTISEAPAPSSSYSALCPSRSRGGEGGGGGRGSSSSG